jgi:hypothetical protein
MSCAHKLPFDVLVEMCRYGGDIITLQFGLTCKHMKELVDERVKMNRMVPFAQIYTVGGNRIPWIIGKYTRITITAKERLRYHKHITDMHIGDCSVQLSLLPPRLLTLHMTQCLLWTSQAPVWESGFYQKGMELMVRDTINKWLPATILDMDPVKHQIYVSYQNWNARWNEWICVRKDWLRLRLWHTEPFPCFLEELRFISMIIPLCFPESLKKLNIVDIDNWDFQLVQWPPLLTHFTINSSNWKNFKSVTESFPSTLEDLVIYKRANTYPLVYWTNFIQPWVQWKTHPTIGKKQYHVEPDSELGRVLHFRMSCGDQ